MSIQTVEAWLAEPIIISYYIVQKQYDNVVETTGIDYNYAIRYAIPGFYDITSDPDERNMIHAAILEYAEAPVAFIGHSAGMTLLFVSFTDVLSFKLKNS